MSLVNQPLAIAGRIFRSRLIMGTGKFSSPEAMRDALAASGTEMVTVALRRADLSGKRDPFANILVHGKSKDFALVAIYQLFKSGPRRRLSRQRRASARLRGRR